MGGDFTTVNGTPKKYLARLLSDGSLDILFNPNGTNARVWAFAAQPDGTSSSSVILPDRKCWPR